MEKPWNVDRFTYVWVLLSNLKTTSRLGHLVTHKYTRNINKMIKLSKTMGGSSIEPMRIWHIKKLWGKFEFKEKVGNSKLIET